MHFCPVCVCVVLLHNYLKYKSLLFTIHSMVFNHILGGTTLRWGGGGPVPLDPPGISAYALDTVAPLRLKKIKENSPTPWYNEHSSLKESSPEDGAQLKENKTRGVSYCMAG